MMMKRVSSQCWSGVFRYSTETLNPNETSLSLYHRIVRFREPSVLPVLDEWVVGEGRPVDQNDLHKIIKQLRKFGRYKHALQVLFFFFFFFFSAIKMSSTGKHLVGIEP